MITPLVSVILATYNGTRYLEEVLLSIRNQTYSNLEIIVIDDASPDTQVGYIVKEMQRIDTRIQYFRNDINRERSWSKNFGVQKSEGDFVAFIDDDDTWEIGKIEKQMQVLLGDSSIGMVGTYASFIDEKNDLVGITTHLKTKSEEIYDAILLSNQFIHSSVVLRKDIFQKSGGFPNFNLCEDYDLWLRVLSLTKAVNIAEPLVNYRVRSSGTTTKNLYKMKWMTIKLIYQYRKNFPHFLRSMCIRIVSFPLNSSILFRLWNTFKKIPSREEID